MNAKKQRKTVKRIQGVDVHGRRIFNSSECRYSSTFAEGRSKSQDTGKNVHPPKTSMKIHHFNDVFPIESGGFCHCHVVFLGSVGVFVLFAVGRRRSYSNQRRPTFNQD